MGQPVAGNQQINGKASLTPAAMNTLDKRMNNSYFAAASLSSKVPVKVQHKIMQNKMNGAK